MKLADQCMACCFACFKRLLGLAKHPERSLDPVAVVDTMNAYCLHLLNLTLIYHVNKVARLHVQTYSTSSEGYTCNLLKIGLLVKDVFLIVPGIEIT